MRSITASGGARWSLSVNPLSPASNTADVLVRTSDSKWTESMISDGIVLNTGIIFIKFADILIAQKRDSVRESESADGPIVGLRTRQFRECLIMAGKQRMLPIFLTTATTVGGLLPLATGGGPLWEGMAWLMIYGLLVATLLTLYIVPALYAIVVETCRVRPVSESPS